MCRPDGNAAAARYALALANNVCADPEPGAAGPALARIRDVLAAAGPVLGDAEQARTLGVHLLQLASAIAVTETVS